MKSTTKTITEITLVLTGEEAEWLRGVMQNPLFGEHPDNEDVLVGERRLALFNALAGDEQ